MFGPGLATAPHPVGSAAQIGAASPAQEGVGTEEIAIAASGLAAGGVAGSVAGAVAATSLAAGKKKK